MSIKFYTRLVVLQGLKRRIKELKEAYDDGRLKNDKEHSNIFVELLNSDLPSKEKSEERLADEMLSIIGAGTETVAWSK